MDIKNIFFDIDNTLIDHSTAESKAIEAIRKKYFSDIDRQYFKKIWVEQTQSNWKLFEKGKLTYKQQGLHRIKSIWQCFDITLSTAFCKTFFNEYIFIYESYWRLFPHVCNTLLCLRKRNFILGVITNGNKTQQIRKLVKTGLYPYMNKKLIIISDEVGFAKPQKEIFLYAQSLARTNPREILYVGDNVPQDIHPALAIRWNTIIADYNYRIKGKNVIHNFAELTTLKLTNK